MLSDLDSLVVTYDGETIEEFTDVEEFFDIQGNTDLGWLRFLTTTGLYVFVRVPHFSEHTITISSVAESSAGVVEAIDGVTAIILYVASSAIVFFVFLGVIIVHIDRRHRVIHSVLGFPTVNDHILIGLQIYSIRERCRAFNNAYLTGIFR